MSEPLKTTTSADGRVIAFAIWDDPEGFPIMSLHGTPGSRFDRWPNEELYKDLSVSEFPEGVYRADVPAEYLIEKGIDSQTAHDLGGIWTLTIKDGRWRGHTQSALNHPDCGGTYSVEAGRFSLRDDECGPSHVVMTARWKLEDGELTFFDIRVGRPLEWGSKPFKKIG